MSVLVLYHFFHGKIFRDSGDQKMKEGVVNEKGEKELGKYTFTTEP